MDISSSNDSLCWFLRLPSEILQIITDFLKIKDVISLSQTCRNFYSFVNDHNFWMHRIRCQYPSSIVQLYTFDLFEKPEIIEAYDEICPTGFAHTQAESFVDQLAINSSTHYNDEAIEKRHAKMYVSKEDFLNNIEFYQFNKPNNSSDILFMKLIYFYLIDRKRSAAVDMNVTYSRLDRFIENSDTDSLTGHILSLIDAIRIEITGRFEHKIMPGKYEVSWRMKCDRSYANIPGETEFIVVPQHGKLLNYKMFESDLNGLLAEHDTRWFTVKMGQIFIYEPSTVLVAIRNWCNSNQKCRLSWDYIELTLVP